jgi:ketosteroid isomerase-like protein
MNEHPNAVTVRSAYEAMEKGDVAALAALLDDGVIWHESTPGFAGDYHGRDQALGAPGQGLPGGWRTDESRHHPHYPGQ